MKVLNTALVRGRGMVTHVDSSDVPRGGLRIGILVHQGDRAWKVKGIEQGPSPSCTQIGLLLQSDGHDVAPEQGTLEL